MFRDTTNRECINKGNRRNRRERHRIDNDNYVPRSAPYAWLLESTSNLTSLELGETSEKNRRSHLKRVLEQRLALTVRHYVLQGLPITLKQTSDNLHSRLKKQPGWKKPFLAGRPSGAFIAKPSFNFLLALTLPARWLPYLHSIGFLCIRLHVKSTFCLFLFNARTTVQTMETWSSWLSVCTHIVIWKITSRTDTD